MVNAPVWVAVAKSPKVLRFFGEGRHVLFHVCGWCRRFVGAAPTGVAGVYNLILARAGAFPMVRGSVLASSEDSKHSLRERPTWLVFRDGLVVVRFVWFGFSHAVARYAEMVCRVTIPFIIPYLVFACSLIVLGSIAPLFRGVNTFRESCLCCRCLRAWRVTARPFGLRLSHAAGAWGSRLRPRRKILLIGGVCGGKEHNTTAHGR